MARTGYSKRYAQAAFELALEAGDFENWHAGLKRLAEIAQDEKLTAIFENPQPTFEEKKKLLRDSLGEIYPKALNLGFLLISKDLVKAAPDILRHFEAMLDMRNGIERAQVATAFPLDEEEGTAISARLKEIVRRDVRIDSLIEPSIIGGFIARIGDRLIDGSIRQRLETLKTNLTNAEPS